MGHFTTSQCFLILFIFSLFVNLGYNAQIPGLYEGTICRKGDEEFSDFICRNIDNCPAAKEEILSSCENQLICCPPTNNTLIKTYYSATEMCSEYTKAATFYHNNNNNNYTKFDDCNVDVNLNLTEAKPKQFPHMALISFNEILDSSWECTGSLISNRFVLTAAHCAQCIDSSFNEKFARWVRLGDLDFISDTDDARPQDYKIVERIIHPLYKPPSRYHDIALFRLERNVDFSPYVRPVCLYTDRLLIPPVVINSGWGQTDRDGPINNKMLQVSLNTISAENCDKKYLSIDNRIGKLSQGIVDDSMVCTKCNEKYGKTFCKGNGGSPIQIKHNSYMCMFSQIGIISFSGPVCDDVAELNMPVVYTRVSKYISWIEQIVWPKI